jgi:hypothetical protein
MDLEQEFEQVIQALNAAGLDYAVCGALALAIHGAPRATTDIDLLVAPPSVDRVLEAVRPLGYTLPAEPMTFGASGLTIQRVTKVHEGDSLTLDLILAGPALEEPWRGRQRLETPFGDLWVVSRSGLLKMKALAGRLQDLADIQRLEHGDLGGSAGGDDAS